MKVDWKEGVRSIGPHGRTEARQEWGGEREGTIKVGRKKQIKTREEG